MGTPGVIDTKRYVRKVSHAETASLTFCRVIFEGVHRRWPDCGQSAYNGRPCFVILNFSFRARTDKRRGLCEKIVHHGISTPGAIDTKRYVRKVSHAETASLTFCRVIFEGVHRRWPDCGQSLQWPALLHDSGFFIPSPNG